MTVIIRPNPGVFRRTMPLVVMFGCFRRYDAPEQLDQADVDAARRVVTLARRYHVPLAYSRLLDDAKNPAPGFWLPDCRPRISDRLFEHGPGSIFQNREFANVYAGITDRRIYFAGPGVDSTLQQSARDILATLRDVQVIACRETLQLCSTGAETALDGAAPTHRDARIDTITVQEWEYSMRCVEYAD